MKEPVSFPRISVCVTSLNRARALEKTLPALLAQDYPAECLELLLLDDGSSDDTRAVMEKFAAEFKKGGVADAVVFRNETNRGLIEARNFLAAKASGLSRALLVLDDDVYLERDSVRRLAAYFFSRSGCAALGPRVVFKSAREKTASAANFINRLTGVYSMMEPGEPVECDWLSTCCLLIDLAAWKKIGGLYEPFYTCHEDPDLCLRLKNNGGLVVYFPEVTVLHDIIPGRTRRERLYYLYRNKFMVFRRNFGFLGFAASSLGTLLFGLPKYLLESLRAGGGGAELLLIVRAVIHGLLGREGRGGGVG